MLLHIIRPDPENRMECIRKYDIELEKEVYYGGEALKGCVVIENTENLRVNSVQVYLRGKAHVEWRVTRAGERRTVKEDQFFVDERAVVWGRDVVTGSGTSVSHRDGGGAGDGLGCDSNLSPSCLSVLSNGEHRFSFGFQLPEGRLLPGSFESRHGTVRYYVRVVIDVPHIVSPLQGLKYFTVVGPLIDRLDARYNTPLSARQQVIERSCMCCKSGEMALDALLERGSYCCGERIRLMCDIQNYSSRALTVVCRLMQTVEYRINKGISGLVKVVNHQALEWCGPTIAHLGNKRQSSINSELRVPVMPPTTSGTNDAIDISYTLQVCLLSEKSGCEIQVDFPIVIVTVPHRILNSQPAEVIYEPAVGHVEGGIYVSPEFLLGQVYDGTVDNEIDQVILYRPVYVCVQTPEDSIDQVTPSFIVLGSDDTKRGSTTALRDHESSAAQSRTPSLREMPCQATDNGCLSKVDGSASTVYRSSSPTSTIKQNGAAATGSPQSIDSIGTASMASTKSTSPKVDIGNDIALPSKSPKRKACSATLTTPCPDNTLPETPVSQAAYRSTQPETPCPEHADEDKNRGGEVLNKPRNETVGQNDQALFSLGENPEPIGCRHDGANDSCLTDV